MQETIKTALAILHPLYNQYPVKYENYWVGYRDRYDREHELEDYNVDDYCEDCIDKALKRIRKEFKDGTAKKPKSYRALLYFYSNYPGCSDGFMTCNECGVIIASDVTLHDSELKHWLGDLDDEEFSESLQSTYCCYELYEILEQYGYVKPEFKQMIEQIAHRVIKLTGCKTDQSSI